MPQVTKQRQVQQKRKPAYLARRRKIKATQLTLRKRKQLAHTTCITWAIRRVIFLLNESGHFSAQATSSFAYYADSLKAAAKTTLNSASDASAPVKYKDAEWLSRAITKLSLTLNSNAEKNNMPSLALQHAENIKLLCNELRISMPESLRQMKISWTPKNIDGEDKILTYVKNHPQLQKAPLSAATWIAVHLLPVALQLVFAANVVDPMLAPDFFTTLEHDVKQSMAAAAA